MDFLSFLCRHYRDQEKYPYPKNNSLIPSLAKYLSTAGMGDPLKKVYTVTERDDYFGVWLALVVESVLPKLKWDEDYNTLVKIKSTSSMDGFPLAVGVQTILRQLSVNATRDFLRTLSHYTRTGILETFQAKKVNAQQMSKTVNAILFSRMFEEIADIPRPVMEEFFPSFIYDCLENAA